MYICSDVCMCNEVVIYMYRMLSLPQELLFADYKVIKLELYGGYDRCVVLKWWCTSTILHAGLCTYAY